MVSIFPDHDDSVSIAQIGILWSDKAATHVVIEGFSATSDLDKVTRIFKFPGTDRSDPESSISDYCGFFNKADMILDVSRSLNSNRSELNFEVGVRPAKFYAWLAEFVEEGERDFIVKLDIHTVILVQGVDGRFYPTYSSPTIDGRKILEFKRVQRRRSIRADTGVLWLPIKPILRLGGKPEPSDFIVLPDILSGADPLHVVLRQAAPQRHRLEAVAAFQIPFGFGKRDPYGPVDIQLKIVIPVENSGELQSFCENLFDLYETQPDVNKSPQDTSVGTSESGWRLWPIEPNAITIDETEPSSAVKIDRSYHTRVGKTYAIGLDLSRTGFWIEEIFKDPARTIDIEVTLSTEQGQGSRLYHRRFIKISLETSERSLIGVATVAGDKALILDFKRDFFRDALPESNPYPSIKILQSELPAKQVDIDFLEPYNAEDGNRGDLIYFRNSAQLDLKFRVGFSDSPEIKGSAADGDFSFDIRHERQVVSIEAQSRRYAFFIELKRDFPLFSIAIDLGTMAIAAAVSRCGGAPVALDLRQILKNAREDHADLDRDAPDPWRESEYPALISSICGLTLDCRLACPGGPGSPSSGAPRACPPSQRRIRPWQRTGRLDKRLDTLAAKPCRCIEAEEAIRRLGIPIEVHAPIYRRDHEERPFQASGMFVLPSIKAAICHGSTLTMHAKEEAAIQAIHQATKTAPAAVPLVLEKIPTEDVLHAVLDHILNVLVPLALETEFGETPAVLDAYWRQEKSNVDVVLTYPASVGTAVRARYAHAFRAATLTPPAILQARNTMPLAVGFKHCRFVPESLAACCALLEHPETLWPMASPSSDRRRLVLFDIGAGTVDVSAIDLFNFEQTVSFSVPLGGNVLDAAIFDDLNRNAAGRLAPQRAKLLDEIEGAKRRMAPSASSITLSQDRIDLADPHEAKHVHAYFAALVEYVVQPALHAASWATDEAGHDLAVVMSGRASLLKPLRDAVEAAVRKQSRLKGTDPVVKLASDIVGVPGANPAEAMKTLVAKGAVLWAQRNKQHRTAEHAPSHHFIGANFAVVCGRWDEKRDVVDISALWPLPFGDAVSIKPPDPQSNLGLFLMIRPPHYGEAGAFKAKGGAEQGTQDHRKYLAHCMRPIVVRSAEAAGGAGDLVEMASPLPFGRGCDQDRLVLPTAGHEVGFKARLLEDGDLSVTFTGLDMRCFPAANPVTAPVSEWSFKLSGSFVPA